MTNTNLQKVGSAELAQIPKEKLLLIDNKSRQMHELSSKEMDHPLVAAISVTTLLQEIRDLFNDKAITAGLMKLQGTKIGFVTDKDKNGGYPPNVVVDVTIEAASRGARMVGNEVNIISGSCYLTKGYFQRKLDEQLQPGNWRLNHGVPEVEYQNKKQVSATVTTEIKWKDSNGDHTESVSFAIKGNDYATADAYLGKADRKCGKWLLENITGERFSDGDADEIISVQATTVTSEPVDDGKLATEEQVGYVNYLCSLRAISSEDTAIEVQADLREEPVSHKTVNLCYKKIAGLIRAKGINQPTHDDWMKTVAQANGTAQQEPEAQQQAQDPNFDRGFVNRQLHSLGTDKYGSKWDAERAKIVSKVDPTAVNDEGKPSSAELTDEGLKEALERLKMQD